MKKYFFLLIIIPMFFGCTNNNFSNKNPFIPSYSFSFEINLSLPSYNNLLYAGSNPVYYPNQGARGIYIFNTGSGYNAFDAACPNQTLSDCSTMTIKGINTLCACDNAEYSLYTGLSAGKEYPMKQYRVEQNGNFLRIYN
jgi:nitrite reductase/ring-hydroxylating ferredoxin subunit